MTPAELANQKEIDQDILYYVREMQRMAQILPESIRSFLTITRRRRMTDKEVQDRIDYLVSAKYLEPQKEFQGGEYYHYRITAEGMELMDGAIPPRNWNKN